MIEMAQNNARGGRGYAVRLRLEGQFCRMTQLDGKVNSESRVA
jgi:hypothetical protein